MELAKAPNNRVEQRGSADEPTSGHMRPASRANLGTLGRYQIQEELGRGAM